MTRQKDLMHKLRNFLEFLEEQRRISHINLKEDIGLYEEADSNKERDSFRAMEYADFGRVSSYTIVRQKLYELFPELDPREKEERYN